MLNQVVFVGRVANQPELFEEDGKKYGKLNIAIQRNTKNSEGIYETDLVNCIVNSSMCNSISEHVKQGDIIGIKGHISNDKNKNIQIMCEKVSFLSTAKQNETNIENNEEMER